MKRSKINQELEWAKALLEKHRIQLPPFAHWSMADWQANSSRTGALREIMLGWDITDFGNDDFDRFGAVLFTLRNGSLTDPGVGTPYAEKLLVLKEGQRLPLHYHAAKTEDIINRGGGMLAIRLYNTLPDGTVDKVTPVQVDLDGIRYTVQAGEELLIPGGHSITLRPFMYHIFWAKEGYGELICGEVSSINDDLTDNYNAEPVSRFSTVEEDEPLLHPLCNEYDTVLGG